jgi:hypothetical protein
MEQPATTGSESQRSTGRFLNGPVMAPPTRLLNWDSKFRFPQCSNVSGLFRGDPNLSGLAPSAGGTRQIDARGILCSSALIGRG